MAQSENPSQAALDVLPKRVPELYLLVRQGGSYRVDRRWGIFDTLGVRVIDDLTFDGVAEGRQLVAFSQEPPHAADVKCVSLPTQVALERVFFHIQGISSLVLNPRSLGANLPVQQRDVEYSIPRGFPEEITIPRSEMPELVGAYSLPRRKVVDLVERGERAFRESSFFEALCLARRARRGGSGGDSESRAWFIELMVLSFMGLPDEALSLYEEYLSRGSSGPEALLLGARFRLLLKQYNEARTILHTLTFNDEFGAVASCELARSYIATGEFDRAIDIASMAIQKDASFYESYLVRGIAQRGLSYPTGDEDGLREALKDLEKVAHHGGFSAPEALFHAATVFGRLGALEQAEVAIRQSLFQRDRYSSRDALVRIVCAAGKPQVAQEELERLSALAPQVTEDLRKEVESHLASATARPEGPRQDSVSSSNRGVAVRAAREALAEWKVPVRSQLEDFSILEDLINRFAPGGSFMTSGDFAVLHEVGEDMVARVFAVHLGDLLVSVGLARWEAQDTDSLALVSSKGLRLPVEAFVQDRIILGASGDNFTSLESLVADASLAEGAAAVPTAGGMDWWRRATDEEVREFEVQAEWTRQKLEELGASLHGTIKDLEEIDLVIERSFEVGGELSDVARPVLEGDVERFVVGLGLLVGQLVASSIPCAWFTHELPEGFSLLSPILGRLFPVARLQRRVYLSSAAATATKLTSFAMGLAAAVVSERIREGVYPDRPHALTALKELLPGPADFSETELEEVVATLWQRTLSTETSKN